ncbi:cytochrome P450 CYP82D47-like [Syzygium oleosum]|uniref:cytochrome P450 CYP82D47-like n=1 Tax=Syzygium oleosum TaxID=219896 RepID=UPI0011D18879|nr:cytochrome P450 CYP82D47-like [Syzygium oleosum]
MNLLFSCLNTSNIGILTAFLLTVWLLWRSPRASKAKLPPEAAGKWPLFGHLHLLAGPKLPHEALCELADKYGPIFRIRVGVHPALVVCSREAAKECFTVHDVAVSSRPKLMSGKLLGYDYANFGSAPYGAYWREMRKVTALELLSNRRLQLLSHIRESEMEIWLKAMYRRWIETKDGTDHARLEMKMWFGDLNLNVILRMVTGKRYFIGSATGGDEGKAGRCQKAVKELFHLAGQFLMADVVPFLEWLDVGGHQKAMKRTAKEMDGILQEWLEELRQKEEEDSSGGVNVEQDFMDVLLSVRVESKPEDVDADTINKATTMSLVAGGTDTTAVTLTWALALLLNNPLAIKRAQAELDIHVGRDRMVKESDLRKLAYVQAIVKETLRLYPPAPLSGMREFTQDCTVGGYHVPAGTRLIVNLWKLQRDPSVWERPDEYEPERFLTGAHKDVDVKGQHFELIPFGGGHRACPRANFGVQMVQLTLASLLHGFDVRTAQGNGAVDMTAVAGLTIDKATPLEVMVRPRLSPTYEGFGSSVD